MAKNRSNGDRPNVVSEKQLLKAMNELEEAVLKGGDELLDADTEGGLSTEGEPLSKKAPKGKMSNTEVNKSDDDSDASDDGSEDTTAKGGDADSDEGSDEASEEGDDDDSGDGDDDSSEEAPKMPMKKGKKIGKSLRQRADADETMAKAIEVSDFIEALVDNSSEAYAELQKAVVDRSVSVEDRLAKSEAYHRESNGRLAKGIIMIGTALAETLSLVKSMTNRPNPSMRKSVLSVGEFTEPHRRGGGGDDDDEGLNPKKVADWLMTKAMAGEIDPVHVTQFETTNDIGALDANIRKALTNDLRK